MANKYISYMALPSDIKRLEKRVGERLLRRIGPEAARIARKEFDKLVSSKYTLSGKSSFKIRTKRTTKAGVHTWGLYASLKRIPLDRFPTRPDISTNTTGANRQPVYFSIKRGVWEYVDRGFIWDGMILRRKGVARRPTERVFGRGDHEYFSAELLNEYRAEVTATLEKHVSKAIDEELKRGFK